MFLELFYQLREHGVPVGIQEWMMLMRALVLNQHRSSLSGFYHVSRACLVKSEVYFDIFDAVFASIYGGVEGELEVTDELLKWLEDPKEFEGLTDEQRAMIEELSRDELLQKYLETLAEQDERHDGGGRWIGTGGHSPFGHGGKHPTGLRVGGPGGGRSAMKTIEERRYRAYRTDETLDLRSTKVALKRLRNLTRLGNPEELDLDETIDETCRQGGEIDLVFRPEKRNNVRLLLLMDVGGSMDPFFRPVSRLLTAMHEERGLRDFRAFYFHNCMYESVYSEPRLYREFAIPTGDLLRRFGERWKLLVVGDASMHPHELMSSQGNIDPRMETETPGIVWLQRLVGHFDRSVWVNPEPENGWDQVRTNTIIRRVIPMYELTVDGIEQAVAALIGARKAA
ncbi:MAG: VWA domain-containing protein [Myxococcales bacterium]|nr:VWA domain-containing protein [Myxococcales bacterium]